MVARVGHRECIPYTAVRDFPVRGRQVKRIPERRRSKCGFVTALPKDPNRSARHRSLERFIGHFQFD